MSTLWEKVAAGRYATELHGHILQAIRKDGPYMPEDRPYIAVVDKVPVGDAWNLNIAKTKAIQFVERQNGKAKAERLFSNGTGYRSAEADPRAEPPMIPDPFEIAVVQMEAEREATYQNYPEPDRAQVETDRPRPTATIAATITDPDVLRALNAIKSTLELMREHADVTCTVNLPPTLEL